MWKTVHPVSSARIQTHNLLIMSLSFNHYTKAPTQ